MLAKADEDRENARLSPTIRWLAFIVLLFLINGSLLFFVPSFQIPLWPWGIPPFNARFLGAIYIAEAASVALLVVYNRWSPARLALTIAIIFTVTATAGTLIHADQLFWPRKRAMLWYFIYAVYVVLPALALWYYRNLPRPPSHSMPSGLRSAAVLLGFVLAAYGLVSFAAPEWATSFWPWPVDAMHGRVYSGIFMAGGAGLVMAGRGGAREEVQVMGTAALALGIGAIVGLYLASASTGREIAYGAGTIVWLVAFAAFAVIGAALLASTRARAG
jgi:hypothetical protein